MRVAELMQTNVQTVGPDASIADAILLLSDSHVTGVPVVDRRGRVLGVLTTTDVLNAAAETAGADERERLFVEDDGRLVGGGSQSDIVRAVALARI